MGITDGTYVCGLCGEWRTSCQLCYEAPMVDMRGKQYREKLAFDEAEKELANQERAIRRAADKRDGY